MKARPDHSLALVLLVLTLIVFWPLTQAQFVNYDDPLYVTNCPEVQRGLSGKGVLWALTTTDAANWHPVTWLSHMADVSVWGLNPSGHHLTNIIFHAANVLLLFFLLYRATGRLRESAITAGLFAWHPLHVESIAWVAERKDVLCAFFFLLSLWQYANYARAKRALPYLGAFLFLALGLMAKPMLVTAPFVFLLLDYWPLRRELSRRLIWEKIPFFALSAISSFLTMHAQKQGGAVVSLKVLPLPIRAANALWSYAEYLFKTAWPANLTLFYPMETRTIASTLISLALVLGITCWCLLELRKRPYMAVGWFWFLGMLVPVIGIVQVGAQSMADRYTYIPLIGIFIAVVWFTFETTFGLQKKTVAFLIILGLCLLRTSIQLPYWRNSLTLFEHAEKYASQSATVQMNLGLALSESGKTNEAITRYIQAVNLEPTMFKAHYNLALEYVEAGRVPEALREFKEGTRLRPDDPLVRNNLGALLARSGDLKEAVIQFTEAVRLDPAYVRGRFNLAMTLEKEGLISEALAQYRKVTTLAPNWFEPLEKISWVLASSSDPKWRNPQEALQLAEKARTLRSQPHPDSLELLAACEAELGHYPSAISLIEQAIKLSNPQRKERLSGVLEKYRKMAL